MTDGVGLHRPLCPDGRIAADAACDAPCAESARPFRAWRNNPRLRNGVRPDNMQHISPA